VLGALIAAGTSLPISVYGVLAVLFGLTHGYANGLAIVPPIQWYAFVPGLGLAGLAVTAYGFVVADWVQHKNVGWMRIAVRVAGSWIAAIGLLVLATSWRRLAA
jgi:urease accessory protein